MERTLFLTAVAALACLAFSSCEKSGDIDATDVTVNVVLPKDSTQMQSILEKSSLRTEILPKPTRPWQMEG